MGRKRCHQWKKRYLGILLLFLGLGMFLALLLPHCIYIVATALVCVGGWLIYVSGCH